MKKIKYAAPLCAAMLFALTLCGPVMAASGDSPASDSWITAKTKMSLTADERVKGRQISVETKDGQIILRGKVDTAEAKSAAEDVAKGIDNVKGVKNELQVVAPLHQPAVAVSDDVITARVKKCFSHKSALRKANIGVTTNDGVVSLSGEVPDFWTSAKASWDAWKESGVKYVKNDLTIKEKPQHS
jgi:hyperosmotically inducible protein